MNGKRKRYLVVGDPIEHSLSPRIHHLFAQQVGIELDYQKVQVSPGDFQSFFENFWASGGAGANVTVPLKALAFEHAQHHDNHAERAGAVNTLANFQGGIWGYNTDGIGLCRDLSDRYGVELTGKTALLLGAGGAARGVVQPLLDYGCRKVVVVNRTESKAINLAAAFTEDADVANRHVIGCGYDALASHLGSNPDVIVNATSFALNETGSSDSASKTDLPGLPLSAHWVADTVCYDMSYGSKAIFCAWAEKHGAALSLDGLGMLVEQAAAAFTIWHDKPVKTQPVMDALRAEVQQG